MVILENLFPSKQQYALQPQFWRPSNPRAFALSSQVCPIQEVASGGYYYTAPNAGSSVPVKERALLRRWKTRVDLFKESVQKLFRSESQAERKSRPARNTVIWYKSVG